MERIEWAARLGIGADADGAGLFLVVHVHQHRTKGVVALYEWVEGQGDPFISYAEDAGSILETRSLHIATTGAEGHTSAVDRDTRFPRAVPDGSVAAVYIPEGRIDRKSTRMNTSHYCASRMPSSA